MAQEAKKMPKRRCSWINRLRNPGQLKLTPFIVFGMVFFTWIAIGKGELFAADELGMAAPGAAIARKSFEPIIGNLGGMVVSVPQEYLHMGTEYESDPHWLESRKGPSPKRTYESKIESLSLFLHVPDMKPHLPMNHESYKRFFKTAGSKEWISVEVGAFSRFYLSDDRLDTPFIRYVPGNETIATYKYKKSPDLLYGLTGYKALGTANGDIVFDDNKYKFGNHNLYFYWADGKISTVIRCGAGAPARAGGIKSCEQEFLLLPEVKARVSIHYPISMLPRWQELQRAVQRTIFGFRIHPETQANPAQ